MARELYAHNLVPGADYYVRRYSGNGQVWDIVSSAYENPQAGHVDEYMVSGGPVSADAFGSLYLDDPAPGTSGYWEVYPFDTDPLVTDVSVYHGDIAASGGAGAPDITVELNTLEGE